MIGQNGVVSSTFPRTRRSRRGYHIDQVEDFLEDARQAYNAEPGAPVVLDADAIRQMAFSMQKGGYSPAHVDDALERLEDAFAGRERERARGAIGEQAWFAQARANAKDIMDRLARPSGKRFRRTSILSSGYNRKQVDALSDRLREYFLKGTPMSVADVRTAAFRPSRGGYQEAQVDFFLDSVVSVMLAVH